MWNFSARSCDKIEQYVARYLSLEPEAALHLQKEYLSEYGTTLSGMMAVHGMDPAPFLDYVHDVDLKFCSRTRPCAKISKPCPERNISSPMAPKAMREMSPAI